MFSDDELTSYFNIHLKYREDDRKYWNQLKKLESAPKEISNWPRKTILHFSMAVATQEYPTVELRQWPQAWGYWPKELLQRPQTRVYRTVESRQMPMVSRYRPRELLQRSQTRGYRTEELRPMSQTWGYWSEDVMQGRQGMVCQPERTMHISQFCGYQSKEFVHRSQCRAKQEGTLMQAPQQWENQARVAMQTTQVFGYQALELMRCLDGTGYQPEERMQRIQAALNCDQISLFPSDTNFPSLKGKFSSKQLRVANILENHAEHLLIEKLYLYFSVLENELKILRDINGHSLKVKLDLTQNYSPCKECVSKIIEFQSVCRNRYHCDIDISITFATFYQFYKFHRFDYGVIYEDYRNKEGLVHLQKSGVQLYLIDDKLREKIKTLLVEIYDIPEETMKIWLQERKLWDEYYMRMIIDESNIVLSPFL
ncbi:hypothetical protein ACJMK2_014142 [Sinanodonta woodiana]|uniref:Activation-induced cytidine deaminase AID domain-containing protein n=1 Tax=Sinanodonta woodiana TaxID=1069815 RepID=A0ABD3V072_SINWO